MAISDIDEMNQLNIELSFDSETDRFSQLSSASPCQPLSSSFGSQESSSSGNFGRDRGQSLANSDVSVMLSSQGNSLRSSLSPMTPFSSDVLDMVITSGPSGGCTSTEMSMPGMFQYNDPVSDDVSLHWMAQEVKQPPREHATAFATPQHYPTHQSHQDFWSPDQGLVAGAAFEPSLSRSIFHHRQHSESFGADYMTRWGSSILQTPPRTVAPSATFQPILPSSPAYRITPSTPSHIQSKDCMTPDFASNAYSSSPVYSPTQQPVYVKNESSCHEVQPTLVRTVRESKCKGSSRTGRKSAERKVHEGSGRWTKLGSSRSGIEYPSYIESNSFACTAEDCVDKNGKRKRFKRQEHLKRHQRTCHTGVRPHYCWVPGCTTKPFSRTDNLNSHLLKTHGKNSPAARNRYIATLDPKSGVFDINYRGPFTDSGWPIRGK